jgi:single-strand DNA-binding protein
MDLNAIAVIGRMTKDIAEGDFGYIPSGKAKLNISIAVNDGYGENKTVSYFDVTIWGKPAETLKQYLGKGKQVAIEGRLKQDRWEKDGQKRSRVYIIANNVQLLGGNTESAPAAQTPAQDNGGDFPEDLPF